MIEGSPHQPRNGIQFYLALGGLSAGEGAAWAATSEDVTRYFETIPISQLETALWYEADRMAAPAFHADSATLETVWGAIQQERDQRAVNVPFGFYREMILATVFPPDHPYARTIRDSLHRFDSASAEALHQYCAAHYVPSNAVLSVSGDVRPAQVQAWVEKYFSAIPRGDAPHPMVPASAITTERRVVLEDSRARAPLLHIVWTGVGVADADKMPLQALAFAMAGDRRSGLRKALIYDAKLATAVSVNHFDVERTGFFAVDVTAAASTPLTRIEQIVDSAVAEARAKPVDPLRILEYQNHNRDTAVWSLQPRGARTDTLSWGQTWVKDPSLYAKQIDQADRLTVADLQRVARQYLVPGRVVMSAIPAGQAQLISKPELPYTRVTPGSPSPGERLASAATVPRGQGVAAPRPEPPPEPRFVFPQIARRTLPNGLRLFVVPNHTLPLVAARLVFDADSLLAEDPAKAGLYPFALAMLREGSTMTSPEALAAAQAQMGFVVSPTTFTGLAQHFDRALALMADMVINPLFPQDAIERVRAAQLANLRRLRSVATLTASRVVVAKVCGVPPRGATEAGLAAITRDDLLAFQSAYLTPQLATLVVVGDVSVDDAVARATSAFGGWKRGSIDHLAQPECHRPDATHIYLVDHPGTQTSIEVGAMGPPRGAADADAVAVMKAILDGGLTSRLGANIRDAHGWAYSIGQLRTPPRAPTPGVLASVMIVANAKVDSALIENLSENRAIAGPRPPTAFELQFARGSLAGSLGFTIETDDRVATLIANDYVRYAVPSDYHDRLRARIDAVTPAEASAAAAKYLDPSHLAIVVVGDRKVIEGPLRAANLAPVIVVDENGTPIPQ